MQAATPGSVAVQGSRKNTLENRSIIWINYDKVYFLNWKENNNILYLSIYLSFSMLFILSSRSECSSVVVLLQPKKLPQLHLVVQIYKQQYLKMYFILMFNDIFTVYRILYWQLFFVLFCFRSFTLQRFLVSSVSVKSSLIFYVIFTYYCVFWGTFNIFLS